MQRLSRFEFETRICWIWATNKYSLEEPDAVSRVILQPCFKIRWLLRLVVPFAHLFIIPIRLLKKPHRKKHLLTQLPICKGVPIFTRYSFSFSVSFSIALCLVILVTDHNHSLAQYSRCPTQRYEDRYLIVPLLNRSLDNHWNSPFLFRLDTTYLFASLYHGLKYDWVLLYLEFFHPSQIFVKIWCFYGII